VLRAVFSWVYVGSFFDLVLGGGLGVLGGVYALRDVVLWFWCLGVCISKQPCARRNCAE
jgi:hypothetical protein